VSDNSLTLSVVAAVEPEALVVAGAAAALVALAVSLALVSLALVVVYAEEVVAAVIGRSYPRSRYQ
jgi:hypothetical protein